MKRMLARSVDWIDDRLAAASLSARRERPSLLAFLFHGVFESAEEVAAGHVWPAQPLLTAELERFIDYFQGNGYRFVRPAEIVAGLDPSGYYALLTFDDGYANNLRALPILRARNVPATFFISAGNSAEGRGFWWDVVYRERRRQGLSFAIIRPEVQQLKQRSPEGIDAFLRENFGAEATRPIGETDRPLTPDELRDLAADPLATIGNHTVTHPDLTRSDRGRVTSEIRECQAYLTEVTGAPPRVFAYPNGWYDERAIDVATELGLEIGVTVRHGKNRLPLVGRQQMTIARNFIPCGAALLTACQRSRSDVQVRPWLDAALP